jgi:hypothetical protein
MMVKQHTSGGKFAPSEYLFIALSKAADLQRGGIPHSETVGWRHGAIDYAAGVGGGT